MRKIAIGMFSLFLLISCGDSVKTYSKEEKQEIIKLADENNKSKQELDNILKNLKEKAEKGNNEAKNEYEEFMALINSKVKIRQTIPIKL
ncbi:hypothetical protein [Cetobacterium somerae]